MATIFHVTANAICRCSGKIMKKWFKRLDISTGLQLSLIISALFCLFIGAVGLYTWHQQRIEIDFAIDQNFPKIQAAFRMEEQINVLENTLLNAKNIRNTEEKIKWFNALQKQIKTLKDVTQSLNDDLNDEIPTIVIKQANLLQELSSNIDNQLILNTKFNKILSEINWLHNDFRDEFKALLQEIIWQQTTLANHLKDNLSRSKQIEQLRKFQYELLLLYDFLTYEEQIVTELKQHIVNRSDYSLVALTNSLNYLKNLIDQKVKSLDNHTRACVMRKASGLSCISSRKRSGMAESGKNTGEANSSTVVNTCVTCPTSRTYTPSAATNHASPSVSSASGSSTSGNSGAVAGTPPPSSHCAASSTATPARH